MSSKYSPLKSNDAAFAQNGSPPRSRKSSKSKFDQPTDRNCFIRAGQLYDSEVVATKEYKRQHGSRSMQKKATPKASPHHIPHHFSEEWQEEEPEVPMRETYSEQAEFWFDPNLSAHWEPTSHPFSEKYEKDSSFAHTAARATQKVKEAVTVAVFGPSSPSAYSQYTSSVDEFY